MGDSFARNRGKELIMFKQHGTTLAAGILFGLGLAISQMVDRGRVLNFLDLFGTWDPTLLFVLAGAVGVTVVSFHFVLRRPQPVLAEQFHVPLRQQIDRPLVLGAALFGIGWGISGYCPGPGLAGLALDLRNPVLFLGAFIAGSTAYQWLVEAKPRLQFASTADRSTGEPARSSAAGESCG
jgi:uncharacterized protein